MSGTAEPWYRWGPGQRDRIFTRDGHCCRIRLSNCECPNYPKPGPCDSKCATVIDHIIPGGSGGSLDDANLRAGCWRCNQDRRNSVNTPTPTYPEYW